ncbi:hypothetical protein COU80_03105 [Candidatus Peregrinibacteria bacterium CG10_big_fil_rev_8_21_14_0_10_55_24]|nr:MAG: hypothetical protein COU80_03105 [Candidatus Peregrinibacteria bacterium CG10_big_fil_rev_8_21_14_0_10_55_24]
MHLCGGLPIEGNPNSFFYSHLQLLGQVFSPWTAFQLSIFLALGAGYVAWYGSARRAWRLSPAWAHALALLCTANGFHVMHALVGHINFLMAPLLGAYPWILLDQRGDTQRSLLARAAAGALLTAMILHAAGAYVLVLGILLLFPLALFDVILTQHPWERVRIIALRAITCGTLSALLCAEKIVAILSLMQEFPRTAHMSQVPFLAVPKYIALALWALPQKPELYRKIPWEFHEHLLPLSPVVAIGLLCALVLAWKERDMLYRSWRRSAIALSIGALILLAFMELIAGQGMIASRLVHLPVFSSFRVSLRFLYPLSLLLSIVAILALQRSTQRLESDKEHTTPLFIGIITILSMMAVMTPYTLQHVRLNYNIAVTEEHLRSVSPAWLSAPVTVVNDTMPPSFDTASSRSCDFDALFVWARQPQKLVLHAGPVDDVTEGAYNLINPSCYVYPRENDCQPGDRIRTEDRENLERFTHGEPVTWRMSLLQHIANWTSLLTLLSCIGIILLQGLWRNSFRKGKA